MRLSSLSMAISFGLFFCGPARAGDDAPMHIDAGPKPPSVAGMPYASALGLIASAGWKGPVVISNGGHMSDDVKCWADGKRCLQAFYAPQGGNVLQVVKALRPDGVAIEKQRLVPGNCSCDSETDDEGFVWSASTARQWRRVDGDTYIDPASEKTVPGGATALDVLNDYKEISSAQMFGLSDVERLVFLCGQDKMVSKSDTWFEDRMGRGNVAKAFPTPKAKPTPVPVSYRKVFQAVCAR